LYVNGKKTEVKESVYPPSIVYIDNYLGYSFEGEMSAVYFIKLDKEEVQRFHEVLTEVSSFIEMEDLVGYVLTGEAKRRMFTQLEENFDFSKLEQLNLINRILLQINPNTIKESTHKNLSIRSVIENMGNISCFLPFLNYLIGISRDLRLTFLKTLFDLMQDFLINNIQATEHFMGQRNDGLAALFYLLHSVAKDNPFEIEVLNIFTSLIPTIKQYYYSFYHKYLTLICFNNSIWRHSDHNVQSKVIECMNSMFNAKDTSSITLYIDVLLSFIGSDKDEEIKEMVINLLLGNVSKDSLDSLFNYVKCNYSKDRDKYTVQVYYVLYCFLKIYISCNWFK